jgi:hypothetical protein
VNAAASSDSQPKGVWEGRAAHATAKATDSIRIDRSGCWTSPGYGRWHAPTGRCGTGETLPGSPGQAKAVRIRPEVEVARSQEGVRGARSTEEGGHEKPLEGRGPASVVAATRGKREGMAARPNTPIEEARELLVSLWMMAKRQARQGRSDRCQAAWGDARVGALRAPGAAAVHAASGRPSVSRVLENCTHGLKGGSWRRAA